MTTRTRILVKIPVLRRAATSKVRLHFDCAFVCSVLSCVAAVGSAVCHRNIADTSFPSLRFEKRPLLEALVLTEV
jgi:hypothetical protein